MKVILATGNSGKVKEFDAAFSDLGIQLLPQPKEAIYAVEETGTTFVENAIIKARHTAQIAGNATIADDSGLIVNALNGAPGVTSARYSGEQTSAQSNNNKLLDALQQQSDRSAYFYCVLVYMRHAADPAPLIAEASWHGHIALEKSGTGGFGYDPIFVVPEYNKTASELDAQIKRQISHRGQAVNKLKKMFIEHKLCAQ